MTENSRSDHNAELVALVEGLARDNFAGRAASYDAESAFPKENYADLREAGLLSLTVPREYGGLGVDPATYVRCLLEMAKGCPSTALTFNMHANVLSGFINVLATEEQKRQYFSEAVEQGALFASVTSEPESSFRDRFILRTRVAREGDGFRFSGLKHFCSLGDAADYCFVSGVLDGAESAREGLLAALIPRDNPGVEVAAPWNATGMRGTTSHTIRYDCLVPEEAVIGKPGEFFEADFSGFALGYAAVYLGIAECAYEHITEYAKNRVHRARHRSFNPPSPDPAQHRGDGHQPPGGTAAAHGRRRGQGIRGQGCSDHCHQPGQVLCRGAGSVRDDPGHAPGRGQRLPEEQSAGKRGTGTRWPVR